MAADRPHRANAGRNIGKLLDQEQDADDFYKTAYGGFEEVSGDEEYETEESEDDVVDSDFDVEEAEAEPEDSQEEEEPRRKKKKWLKPFLTKAKVPAKATVTDLQAPKPKKTRAVLPYSTPVMDSSAEPRNLRRSTMEVSEEFRRRQVEEERKRKRTTPRTPKLVRKLTQKELLQEAKVTEIENLVSLEAFTRLEAEKKKVKEKKTVLQGPVVRFHSVSMPLITEIEDIGDNNTTIAVSENGINPPTQEKYCRNFMVFTDTQAYPSAYFCSRKPLRPKRRFCPITGLQAKYVDPLTGTPYATAQAFKIIRNRYVMEEEQKCEKRLLQLSSWLEEKKRKKLETKL